MVNNVSERTALHYAADRGHLESAKLLIEADRNKKLLRMVDINKRTALHLAVEYQHPEIVELLVEADPDFEYSADKFGNTPLFMAWEQALSGDQGTADIRKLLIRKQSTQCQLPKGENKWTLIHHATYMGDLSTVKEIIHFWPDCCELADKEGQNFLHLVAKFEQVNILKYILELRNIVDNVLNGKDNYGNTPLHYAVKKHHLAIVKLLVEADPDFDYSANNSGHTPLFMAMQEALSGEQITVDIRKFLIQKQPTQCKVRIGTKGWTILHHATFNGDLSAVEEIVQFCPDCSELIDNDNRNFLHLATEFEHEKLVKLILGLPSISDNILNGQESNGDTPLHIATSKGLVSLALPLLYHHRVNKTVRNKQGESALDQINFEYDKRKAGVLGILDLVDEKELKDRSDFDLLVGALIATVSFTAGIMVPGGYISDGPNRGNAILYKKRTSEAFVVFNTIALALSLFAVFSHFCMKRLVNKKDIIYQLKAATFCSIGAIFAMMVAFIMGSFAVLSISLGLAITICGICCCFFGFSFYSLWRMRSQKRRGSQV